MGLDPPPDPGAAQGLGYPPPTDRSSHPCPTTNCICNLSSSFPRTSSSPVEGPHCPVSHSQVPGGAMGGDKERAAERVRGYAGARGCSRPAAT